MAKSSVCEKKDSVGNIDKNRGIVRPALNL
jgi:hypothetical protein